jgi:hypothetical protein
MKKLFLCHFSGDAAEVYDLAQELRLHGIIPWVDKQGGFLIGDSAPEEARRAIREDCDGLLFYATPQAFERPFIRDVEIHTASEVVDRNPAFALFAVPRRMGFGDLSKLSKDCFGRDLGLNHTRAILEPDGAGVGPLTDQFASVAKMVLSRHITNYSPALAIDRVAIQFSTRELLPPGEEDLLQVDATGLFRDNSGLGSDANWRRVERGLVEIKEALAGALGRPRLLVHGSKHLTAAYILGYVFCRASGFNLEIRQRNEYWKTDLLLPGDGPFATTRTEGSLDSSLLAVEVTATGKSVSGSVHRYLQLNGISPQQFISFIPKEGFTAVDNGLAVGMAIQIRRELEGVVGRNQIDGIHLFGAVPQSLALMIGHHLNALPPVQLYEFDGLNYHPSIRLSN